LRDRYLPIAANDSIWRFNRFPNADDPDQGWKLHVSATILSANQTFARIASYLEKTNVMFKAPHSLEELYKLNSGMHYGYSQVGKFITVYPKNVDEAVTMARELDRLTDSLSGPVVPFDSRFGPASSVYYRYGSFDLQMPDGKTAAIRDPNGQLVEDSWEKPEWVDDPFARPTTTSSGGDLASTPFRVFKALSQRGKGGVYQAFDVSFHPPRLCVIKQGRAGGEVSWARKDGASMLRHEARTLANLARAGVEVPLTYSQFQLQQHQYVVMEHIEGESLQTILEKQETLLPVCRVVDFATQISSLVSRIHRAGWLWLDCKPANLILTPNGKLRPLDFEGACRLKQTVSPDWQTPAFIAPRDGTDDSVSASEDVYAFGVTCYYLLTGQLPERSQKPHMASLGSRVSKQFCELIDSVLSPNSQVRPAIEEVNVLLASC
jgi:hypothetical protein